MKYVMLILALVLSGCEAGGIAGAGGGGGSDARSSAASALPDSYVYTFEFSGSGIIYTADIDGYASANYTGAVTSAGDAGYTLGAATRTYSVTAKSLQATFTYNGGGGGVLSIVTKRDGVVIRNDGLTLVGASVIITEAN